MASRPRIGTTIRRARERLHMRQQDLAAAVGVSRTTVDAWENDRTWPKNRLGALEELLGISVDGSQGHGPELVAEDEWEAQVLADRDFPDYIKRQLIADSRAARAAYRERKAALKASHVPDRAG